MTNPTGIVSYPKDIATAGATGMPQVCVKIKSKLNYVHLIYLLYCRVCIVY